MTDHTNQYKDEKVVELIKALGKAYLENGDNVKASDKFKQLYVNGVQDKDIVQNYALSLARTESTSEEALGVFTKAIEIEKDDESLYLTLATLFLKENVTAEPALRVFRRSLAFSPPFEEDIRMAIEKIFQETTQTLTLSEIRETLLECVDSPELLSIFVATAWRDKKFKETVKILKDLYSRSNRNQVYLKALCETLLQYKKHSEETGEAIKLSGTDVHLCLKYNDIHAPITRINQIDSYLDFKNLFLAYQTDGGDGASQSSEYEFILTDDSMDKFDEISDTTAFALPQDIDPTFSLKRDLIEKIRQGASAADSNYNDIDNLTNWQEQDSFLEYQINTIAIFEINNYDTNPNASKLPFQTFMKLIATELSQSHIFTLCATTNGIITFCTNPRKMLEKAIETLEKVERYNMVVDESEIIELRATLHCSQVPFIDVEYQGIREIRKAAKTHNLVFNKNKSESETLSLPVNTLLITNEIALLGEDYQHQKMGDFKFNFFPGEHAIFKVGDKQEQNTPAPVKAKTNSIQQFGKYEITELLKEGHLTTTYRGYDPQLERAVLIKAYKTKAYADFKEFISLRKQFYEEVRKFNRINHPNIGVIYDAGEDGDLLYFVREYVESNSLNQYLHDNGASNINTLLKIFIQSCKIISHLHQNQIWHKNLKPENIFVIGIDDDVKIVDGGLLQVHSSDKFWDSFNEEIAYIAPEQIKGAKLTLGCDIYQLGVIIYESLTNINPFQSSTSTDTQIKIIADDPPPISSYRTDIPEQLDQILLKALHKSPEKRFKTIKEFEHQLTEIAQQQEITTKRRLFELL